MHNHLELLRIFGVAAESPSFREAASRLGMSPQGVTRAVKALENHFGELLFHRSTRQVRITEFGEQLAARVRPALVEMEALFRRPGKGVQSQLAGRVRLTAPRSLSRCCIMPALGKLAAEHPEITLDVRLSDAIVNVVDEQIDVGVRIGFLRDSRFVARQAGRMGFVLVGTPGLIARAGKPARIEQLSELPTTAMLDLNTGRAWPWYFAGGRQFTPASPAFITDDAETEMDAVLAGVAYGQLADYMAKPHIHARRLVPVLQKQAPTPWGIYVYRPQRGPVPARVRLVFDQIRAAIGELESDS